ncbi:MAG: hypothetical protein J2P52_07715 [Blastocatellia bacterium]|nr:hypothetical protein [Blastocatellia bacterium]
MLQRTTAITVLIGSILPVLAACGGRLYKVAPLPASAPPEISVGKSGGLDIGAIALDGERSYERFEANLPLAGVIAVDVRMINKSESTIMTNSLRFELRNASGVALKRIAPKKALGVVMKYYGDKFYAKVAYQRTLEDYESVSLKQGSSIAPEGEIRGIVFFQAKRETTSVDGLILSVAGLTTPINVQLQTAHN